MSTIHTIAPNLVKYVDRKNAWARIFNDKVFDLNNLTNADKVKLNEMIEYDLSPENVSCDGEVIGDALIRKVWFLDSCQEELKGL